MYLHQCNIIQQQATSSLNLTQNSTPTRAPQSSLGMMVKGRMGQEASRSRAVMKQSGAWLEPRDCRASPRPLHASCEVLWTWTASRRTFSPRWTRPVFTSRRPWTDGHMYKRYVVCIMYTTVRLIKSYQSCNRKKSNFSCSWPNEPWWISQRGLLLKICDISVFNHLLVKMIFVVLEKFKFLE